MTTDEIEESLRAIHSKARHALDDMRAYKQTLYDVEEELALIVAELERARLCPLSVEKKQLQSGT